MSRIAFDSAALEELLSSIAYYEEQEANLGRRFKECVEAALASIRKRPLSYRLLKAPFRRCLVEGFPFRVIYSIETDFIYIIAVAHLKRRPDYWSSRI